MNRTYKKESWTCNVRKTHEKVMKDRATPESRQRGGAGGKRRDIRGTYRERNKGKIGPVNEAGHIGMRHQAFPWVEAHKLRKPVARAHGHIAVTTGCSCRPLWLSALQFEHDSFQLVRRCGTDMEKRVQRSKKMNGAKTT